MPHGRVPLTADELRALRAHADQVRANARELIVRCAALQAKHQAMRERHEEQLTEVAELRDHLRKAVGDYAGSLRRLETAPENAVVLVKELTDGLMTRLAPGFAELRHDVVTWAIDGYFAA